MPRRKKTPDAAVLPDAPPRLPVGVSDFAELIRGGYIFVDKTLMIEEVVRRGAQVTLITRPRRFGKTLNLGMLQYFFAAEVDGRPTAGLFDTLAIARHPGAMAHQGRYPAIFFTFKDMEGKSFEMFEDAMRSKLASLVGRFSYLRTSPQVTPSDRNRLDALDNRKAGYAEMADAFRLLSELLYRHHGEKVVVLLDEYDAPIHAAYANKFYKELIDFMRPMLSAVLKDNRYLHKAVLTGILRVSRETLFSGLNNIEVHTVLNDGYSQYFGFTEERSVRSFATNGTGEANPSARSADQGLVQRLSLRPASLASGNIRNSCAPWSRETLPNSRRA